MATTIRARQALTAHGWRRNVAVTVDGDGVIDAVSADNASQRSDCGVLLPAPANLHSHAFQRAMAGMTETRGPDGRDSFWTWRQTMFRFLDRLAPDDVEAITAFAQMEMLESGFAAVAEFHYLHHQPGGAPYANIAEMAVRVCAAAAETGIGLTLLPVLYRHGGCDLRPLSLGQIRFGCDPALFERLYERSRSALAGLPADARLGVAPHSLRAVDPQGVALCASLADGAPIHIHAAEQPAEVEEVVAALGARPVAWLLANLAIGPQWCLIHATQTLKAETLDLARSGATAGLCPLTEASLGDGVFDGARFLAAGGRIGIGTDSNIAISLAGELRQLEYTQRLRDKARAVLATAEKSTGRNLFDCAVAGGARALGRQCGAIATGFQADLVALDDAAVDLEGRAGDAVLDAWLFAMTANAVTDVWSSGRHVVAQGVHRRRASIAKRYRAVMGRLREAV